MERVLIVEDNEANLYLAQYLLEKAGFQVVSARDGLEGIRCAEAECPDLIIMDIQLPEIDGVEAMRRIRENPRLQGTPIVAMSAYVMESDKREMLSAGFDGYLEKPIGTESFADRIRSFLD